MATDKQQLETLLEEVCGKLHSIREEIDYIDDRDVEPLLKNISAQVTKAEELADEAYSLWEDIADDFSEEDIAQVLRALKHLGISGIDSLTDASIRMAMEQVVGL
jgi:hypothetical protein